MKQFISLLMSLYIVCIACDPCSERDNCNDSQKSPIEIDIADQEHPSDEPDLCSPFCICSCCSPHISQPKNFYFSFYIPKVTEVHSGVKPSFLKVVPRPIWQPPKLA